MIAEGGTQRGLAQRENTGSLELRLVNISKLETQLKELNPGDFETADSLLRRTYLCKYLDEVTKSERMVLGSLEHYVTEKGVSVFRFVATQDYFTLATSCELYEIIDKSK
jgi:hypothetical protein